MTPSPDATEPRRRADFAPQGEDRPLLPFLPMVYVAWADGELSPGEIGVVRRRARDHGGLDEACRQRLDAWLDPAHPPAARELAAMLRVIRRAAPELGERQRLGLADLGRRLAVAEGEGSGDGVDPATAEALSDLEAALGVVGDEAAAEILSAERPRPPAAAEEAEPPFSVPALTRWLDGEHAALRQRVRELLSAPAMAPPGPLPAEDYRELVLERTRRLADEGLGALSYPPDAGGEGDLGRFIAAFETLAFGDLSVVVKFGVQFGLFGGSILQLGSERHHREYLRRVGTLELPGCFAMSETGHGSNVRELETVARYLPESDEIEVHTPHSLARKDWIGNAAAHGRTATVFARLLVPAGETGGDEEGEGHDSVDDHGVHAVLVPIRGEDGRPRPGVEIEDCGHKEGLNGVDNGRLRFHRVRVPRENLLDRFGGVTPEGRYESPIPGASKRFFTMLGTLVGGRISVAAAAVSAAKTGLAVAVRYGALRRQFGPPGEPEVRILDYQAHQRRLLPRLAAAYAHHCAVRWVAQRFVERSEDDSREVETLAAAVKALATWATVDTLQTCREACGGQGYLSVNRFDRLKRDTDVFTTFEGDNTVLLQLVARGRLSEYKRRFGDLRAYQLARHVLDRAATELSEKNPLVVRRTDREHLRDPELHRSAFVYREESLLASVARRLKTRLDDGVDSFTAFNQCQDHLVAMARAFGERVALERFQAAVAECEDEALAEPLGRLCALWALWRLEEDAGWFLENGYLEGGKAAAIRDEVLALCAELRPVAVPLVDAFDVPEPWLAPIAFGQGTERT